MRLDRQSRHSPLRQGDRPVSRKRPLDHVRARVPRPLARAMAAGSLHVSVLPRRGSVVRCGPSSVCRMPAREFRRVSHGLGSGARGRGAIGEADEPAAPWRADRSREPPPAHSRDAVGRPPRWRLRAARRIAGGGRRRPSQPVDARGLPRLPVPTVPRNRKRHHATVYRRRAAGRIPGADRRGRARVRPAWRTRSTALVRASREFASRREAPSSTVIHSMSRPQFGHGPAGWPKNPR